MGGFFLAAALEWEQEEACGIKIGERVGKQEDSNVAPGTANSKAFKRKPTTELSCALCSNYSVSVTYSVYALIAPLQNGTVHARCVTVTDGELPLQFLTLRQRNAK